MSKYDYEKDFYGENDIHDINSRSNNREKIADYMTSIDPNDKLCFVKKIPNIENTGPKMTKVILYGSGNIGTVLRNAVTGAIYYGHKVGSKNESLYFKVKICTGEFGKEPLTLFYDSVEQYERHMKVKIDKMTKQKVAIRQITNGQREEKKQNTVSSVIVH